MASTLGENIILVEFCKVTVQYNVDEMRLDMELTPPHM